MSKLTMETIRMIEDLAEEKREKVELIVRRHVAACQRNGFLPENLERVYIEAVEMVDLDERYPEPVVEEIRDWEPLRRYDQYVGPRAA
ncbi:MAG: hypothetical protein AB7H86_13055 [Blastocatellales bacterium]